MKAARSLSPSESRRCAAWNWSSASRKCRAAVETAGAPVSRAARMAALDAATRSDGTDVLTHPIEPRAMTAPAGTSHLMDNLLHRSAKFVASGELGSECRATTHVGARVRDGRPRAPR